MVEDPIVNEERKVRDEHARKFNYNLKEIYNDIKKSEKKHSRKLVTLSPKRFLKAAGI